MILQENSLLFLLGAGASVDAGIMHTKNMTRDIEKKIKTESEFKEFKELYNYLKSSIIYQKGLKGEFEEPIVTIEELLDALSEINQRHQNRLYPFIGGWDIHLLEVVGEKFGKIEELDKKIRSELFTWINIKDYDEASYFQRFCNLIDDIGTALRVFTLNYDICVERALGQSQGDFTFEIGFDASRCWEASRFEANENVPIGLYLYKLHGSINWIKDGAGTLKLCDDPQQKNSELRFGTAAKLNLTDPYLFYIHELRKYSLNKALRFIVAIGYSFSDDYINELIKQAVHSNEYLKILVVFPSTDGQNDETEELRIAKLLNIEKERIIHENLRAKKFFEDKMKLSYFEKVSSAGDNLPF